MIKEEGYSNQEPYGSFRPAIRLTQLFDKTWVKDLVQEKVGAKARVKEDVDMEVDKGIGIMAFAEAALHVVIVSITIDFSPKSFDL